MMTHEVNNRNGNVNLCKWRVLFVPSSWTGKSGVLPKAVHLFLNGPFALTVSNWSHGIKSAMLDGKIM